MALFDIPRVQRSPHGFLGFLGLIGGLGIIIQGLVNDMHKDTIIMGAIQLAAGIVLGFILPPLAFLAWVWAAVWGILIFVKSS